MIGIKKSSPISGLMWGITIFIVFAIFASPLRLLVLFLVVGYLTIPAGISPLLVIVGIAIALLFMIRIGLYYLLERPLFGK